MFYSVPHRASRLGETGVRAYADEELGKAAGRIWTEGRANPIDWEIRTRLGMSRLMTERLGVPNPMACLAHAYPFRESRTGHLPTPYRVTKSELEISDATVRYE